MEILKLNEELQNIGISVGNYRREGEVINIPTSCYLGVNLEIRGMKVTCQNRLHETPLHQFLKEMIDLDEWKHSLHIPIITENYEKIGQIIGEKILDRAKELKILLIANGLINYEIEKESARQPD